MNKGKWAALAIVIPVLAAVGCSTGGLRSPGNPIIPEETTDFKTYFSSNRDGTLELYRMDPDGSNTIRLTHNEGAEYFAVVTLDGSKVVYVLDSGKDRQIYTMDADGSRQRQITHEGETNEFPRWSPNGKRITFISDRDGNREVYVMNADGSDQKRLTNTEWEESDTKWSPDGKKIAYVSTLGGGVTKRFLLWMPAAEGRSM